MSSSFNTKELNQNNKRPKLPISHEFDLLYSHYRSKNDVDRSHWLETLLNEHPEINQTREEVNPLVRAATFSRNYLPAKRLIPHETLLALISQHFRTLGLSQSQASLHSEWGYELNIPPLKLYSQLALLLQRGVYRTEKFWELSMPSVHAPSTQEQIQKALDEEISKTIGDIANVPENESSLADEMPDDERFIKYEIVTSKGTTDDKENGENKENGEGKEPSEYKEPVEASLNQIIYYITKFCNSKNTALISELTSALCLTISSYASNKVFFKKIRERFDMLLNSNDSESKGDKLMCVKLLKEWVHRSINEIEPQILDSIKQYVDQNLMVLPEFSKYCQKMFEGRTEDTLIRDIEGKAEPVILGEKCAKTIFTGEFSLFDLPIEEFARQLTVWSSNRYYSIKNCELLDCAWAHPRLKYRAPNVVALTEHYNILNKWVQYSILSEPKLANRISRMEYFISLSQALFDMNNFYDSLAVVSSFEANSIFRLNVHLSLLSPVFKEKLQTLQKKMDVNGNFVALRTLYDGCLRASKPALPYIGVLLSDLFKYYDATKTYVEGLINIRKFRAVHKMIAKIKEFMRDKYCIYPIDQVQDKIDQWTDQDDDELYEMSYDVEKEGAQTPKDLKDA